MGLSSTGLGYIVDGLKNIHKYIQLNLSENNIEEYDLGYLKSYINRNRNISYFMFKSVSGKGFPELYRYNF